MKLLEFLTYCQLKGFIVRHAEVEAEWDTNADSHWKIVLDNGDYKAYIAYAVVQDTGVTMSTSLHHKGGVIDGNVGLDKITKAFIPDGT